MKKGKAAVTVSMEGNILVVRIDTDHEGEASKTGKSKVVATTSGFVGAGNGRLSLNFIR